jgi:hypothetical protein
LARRRARQGEVITKPDLHPERVEGDRVFADAE